MIADTSFVVALMNANDGAHPPVRRFYARRRATLVTTPLALAEMDHMLTSRGGAPAAAALRDQLDASGMRVAWWEGALRATTAVAERYASLGLGLTDASLVALAGHLGTATIATLDERRFRHIEPLTGEPAFTLLPADAD